MWRLDYYLRKYAWWRKWRGLPEPQISMAALMVTKEALRILKGTLVLTEGVSGAKWKMEPTIKIRNPPRYAYSDASTKEEHF